MHVFNWVSLLIANQSNQILYLNLIWVSCLITKKSNTLLKSYFPLTGIAWNILLTASNYIGFSLIFSEKLSRSRYAASKSLYTISNFFCYLQKFFFSPHPIFSTIAVVTVYCTFRFPEVAFILKLDFGLPYLSISKDAGVW